MERPRIAKDNRIIAMQRRASKEIMSGIEEKINDLHGLNAKERMKEFGLFGLLYLVGVLLMMWSGGNLAAFVLGIMVMGVALNSLGIFIHEGLHGLLAEDEKVNHLVSFLVGLPIMMSTTAYQVTHTNHHYELGRKLDYGTYRQYLDKPQLVWFVYWTQLLAGSLMYILFIPILGFVDASRRSRWVIVGEYAVIGLVLGLFVTLASGAVVLHYWLYPLVVMNFMTNLRGLASHALGDVENIYLSSRTIGASGLVSLLFINENYHLEHHLFPRVPSYNLTKVHDLIWDRLPEASYAKGYGDFLWMMLKAAWRNDLSPQGVVRPIEVEIR